jgi:3-oxoacyl-[acyl-carrier protein] reductase
VRIAVVTGGARGIGQAIAADLVASGHKVAVLDVAPGESGDHDTTPTRELHHYRCDVTDLPAVRAAVASVRHDLGEVSVLVNNAGILRQGLLAEVTDADWAATLAANLTGAFYCTREVLAPMLRQGFGRIISVASITAVRGEARTVAYAASKGGLIGLTKALAKETAGQGVTVNAIAPGFVMTDQTRETFSGPVGERLLRQIPMHRFGAPADVAGVAAFLASEAAGYMTGQVLVADGGVC